MVPTSGLSWPVYRSSRSENCLLLLLKNQCLRDQSIPKNVVLNPGKNDHYCCCGVQVAAYPSRYNDIGICKHIVGTYGYHAGVIKDDPKVSIALMEVNGGSAAASWSPMKSYNVVVKYGKTSRFWVLTSAGELYHLHKAIENSIWVISSDGFIFQNVCTVIPRRPGHR